ncbi:rRNA cytosine-C5-methyltransferase [Chitinophaga cymbidii]|uniref:rRNA cytosine-C5-methyltransferase n=1 Tax=Chitinophaga cymbidii TaxID=1096750 RepID=A0A512RLG4_9BACT|nr:rRNA cytosine-C5-methyltransferase [Chitinophaga cymbidii]
MPGLDLPAFLQVHDSPERITSIRLQPVKAATPPVLFPQLTVTPVPWSRYGYYLSSRPSFTFDPYFHAGAYYVQEASSMFLEEAVRQTVNTGQPLKALDLCAAPGGKSTLLQSILHPGSLLVANEVIKPRAAVLADNITRWGADNVVVTNNDPRDFARLPDFFDLVTVDAPCSGSGLFRRDPEAVHEWSYDNVILCSQRQQRILADALPALKPGGILIYSTCSYAMEEDEQIADWLTGEMDMEHMPLNVDPAWNVVPGGNGCGYRFYPDKIKGEGFFIACFRKAGADISPKDFLKNSPKKNKAQLPLLPEKDAARIRPWLKEDIASLKEGIAPVFILHNGEAIILPSQLAADLPLLQKHLYIRKAGVKAGQLTPKELVPDHQLALSTIIAPGLPAVELTQEEALRYLRKEDLQLDAPSKGWTLMRFGGMNLGWAKVLPNRVNNYYPKEMRILKAGTPDY